jgi:hypothetical protein
MARSKFASLSETHGQHFIVQSTSSLAFAETAGPDPVGIHLQCQSE